MWFKKTCASLLLVCLMFSTGLLWFAPPEVQAGDAEPKISAALLNVQGEIKRVLEGLDASLEAAARDLAGEERLDTPRVRSVLSTLCVDSRQSYVVDCCTVDLAGRIAAIEPGAYKAHEGADISEQEQVVRLHQTRKPVMSLNMPMVEGFDAVDLEWPVVAKDGTLKGSVSVLIRPEALVAAAIQSAVEGLPATIWVMEKNGHILYDAHEDKIGRDLFTDAIFKPHSQLLELGKRISEQPTGIGFYECSKEGAAGIVKKHAQWATVGLHGTDWRIVIEQIVAGDR